MPALAPVPGVCKVEIRIGDGASIDAGSRFFMAYSGAPPSAAQQAASASGIDAQWRNNLAAVTENAEGLREVVVTDLSSDTGAVGTLTVSDTGTEGTGPLPASTCALINHVIQRRYRGGKPRTYLRVGMATDYTQTNEWTAAAQTKFTNAWEAFISGIKGITGANFTNIVNVSWFSGGKYVDNPSGRPIFVPTPRATPLVDQITSSACALKLGTQRRRLNL